MTRGINQSLAKEGYFLVEGGAEGTVTYSPAEALSTLMDAVLQGVVYYVSKDGADSNDGKSWETAFLTITAALAVAGDHDTILIGTGIYTEGATLTITQTGLKLLGVQTSGHQWGQPSIKSTATETLIMVEANQVEIAYLSIHHVGAGCGIEVAVTENYWRTHIHDCFFGGNNIATYGIVMGNTRLSGVGAGNTVDAPCTIVERCYFQDWVTASIFMNCGYGSVVRNCVIVVRTAAIGIQYYTDTTSRPHGLILDNKFITIDSTNAIGISVTNTPTAGYLLVDGNHFTNFASAAKCLDKQSSGYQGLNYFGITALALS